MKATLLTSLKNRAYLAPFVLGGLLVVALLLLGAGHIRYSELQVPVRYTSFGITNFYREQWFYQFAFLAFGVLVYVFHTLLGLKLQQKKGGDFGLAFQWLTVAILFMTLVTVAAIFRVADLV